MRSRTIALALTVSLGVHANVSQQNSPVIGIMAQPFGTSTQYIAASYVKFVEAGGGRAVPLSYFADNETTLAWFKQLNGVLLPGGGADLPDAAKLAVEYALKEPNFPLWGTCLGLEWISEALGSPLSDYDAHNVTLPLYMTDAAADSYLLGDEALRASLSQNNLSVNFHQYGVAPSDAKMTILSTSFDAQHREFVSTAELGNILAVQWHPEKNAFENGESPDGLPFEAINHSSLAVDVTMKFAAKLIDRARLSTHQFDSPDQRTAALFDNCLPSTDMYPQYVQVYYFDRSWRGKTPACTSSLHRLAQTKTSFRSD